MRRRAIALPAKSQLLPRAAAGDTMCRSRRREVWLNWPLMRRRGRVQGETTMKRATLGILIAVGCTGGAAAQSTDPSHFVGLWCSGAVHALDSGSIALSIATVNDGVAFGTYMWRGPSPIDVSIQGTVAGAALKITVDVAVSLDVALREGKLHGTLANHHAGRRWDVILTKRAVC